MGKLNFGIHKHTYTSRDAGSIDVSSRDEAIKKINEEEMYLKKIGYVIWFANYRDDNGKEESIHAGDQDYNH